MLKLENTLQFAPLHPSVQNWKHYISKMRAQKPLYLKGKRKSYGSLTLSTAKFLPFIISLFKQTNTTLAVHCALNMSQYREIRIDSHYFPEVWCSWEGKRHCGEFVCRLRLGGFDLIWKRAARGRARTVPREYFHRALPSYTPWGR